MKNAKLIIGIISMVLFSVIMFQSCAVGVVNALEDNAEDTSGGAGSILAILILIAGIVGVVTRKSKGGGITAGVFYILAAVLGFANLGTFSDLVVWSVIALIFGIVFIAGSIKM
ncbi:MAG: hypothetical protein FWE74_06315 [Oscillospiraceae bacterium]|nr:hypothetical protein [Oscillospiraceae bacterium]